MLEAYATVQAVEPGYAWVESERQSACGGCASSMHCGVSALGKSIGRQRVTVRLRDPLGVRPGDAVIIGVSEARLLGVAAAAYLVPLVAMVVCALVGSAISGADAAPPLGAAIGLTGSFVFLWFRRLGRSRTEGGQPVILRRHTDLDRAIANPMTKGDPP